MASKRQPAGERSHLPWEKWENELLEKRFATGVINEIARELKRSFKAVEYQATQRLGLKRDKEMVRQQRRVNGKVGRDKQLARKRPPRKSELCCGHGKIALEQAWRGEYM